MPIPYLFLTNSVNILHYQENMIKEQCLQKQTDFQE